MTIHYPDIYSGDAGINLAGAPAVCVKATQGDWYKNPDYHTEITAAKEHNAIAFGYHFLEAGNGAKQAQWYYDYAGTKPCMLDVETNGSNGSKPSITDVNDFVKELRALGGRIHLLYLPHWFWQEIGSPDLSHLSQMELVSSDYTTYDDHGPGWAAYGGLNVAVWQYSDSTSFGGKTVDFNAFKGTASQLWEKATGGQTEGPKKTPEPTPTPTPKPTKIVGMVVFTHTDGSLHSQSVTSEDDGKTWK